MTNDESLHARYADLLPENGAGDPALERLITDLEIIYPPASYPPSLPERLRSALETHRGQGDTGQPVTDFSRFPRSSKLSRTRPQSKWQRTLGLFAAAVLTALLVSSLLLILHQSREPRQAPTGTSPHTNLPTPTRTPPHIDFSSFWSLSMVSATNGWAVAEDQQGIPTALLYTTDGGFRWKDVSPPQLAVTYGDAFDIQDATTAWITGPQAQPGVGPNLLLRTTDAGQTWQSLSLPAELSQDRITNIHFFNTHLGWITGQLPAQYLWLTQDGGKTWQKRAIPFGTLPANVVEEPFLSFFDEQTWVIANAFLLVNNGHPIIYITHNAGSTWQKQELPTPTGLSLSASTMFEYVQMFSANDGVLAVQDQKSHVFFTYVTHTGGTTWQVTPSISVDAGNVFYGLPRFSDITHGQIFAGPSSETGPFTSPQHLTMFMTSDGGFHWQTIPVSLPAGQQGQEPANAQAGTVMWDFVSPQVGWLSIHLASSSPDLPRNGLYRTLDGGQTWQAV